MTWQHRLAIDPILRTLDGIRARHPGVDIALDARRLAGFELTPYDNCAVTVHTDAATPRGSESSFPIDDESFPIDSEGLVRVPTGPGLGVTVNDAVIAKYRALSHGA